MNWTSRLSLHPDTEQARRELLAGLDDDLGGPADLLLGFASPDHDPERLAAPWGEGLSLGGTAAGVIAAGQEVERGPALGLLAARLPDVEMQVLRFGRDGDLPLSATPAALRRATPAEPALEPVGVLLADPFTVEAQALAAMIDEALPGVALMGGLLSGARGAGGHCLWSPQGRSAEGATLLLMWGDVEAERVVAQGARPLSGPHRITRADRNYVLELDGRPAFQVFQAMLQHLDEAERQRLRQGATVGISALESGDRPPTSGELLVRNLLGVDPKHQVVGIGAPAQEGAWLSFMIRDAQAADEELAERLRQARPAPGGLLVNCLGRGEAFHGEPGHDSRRVQQAVGPLALGGFFANGELGPLRRRTRLHAYTSSLCLFRPRRWD